MARIHPSKTGSGQSEIRFLYFHQGHVATVDVRRQLVVLQEDVSDRASKQGIRSLPAVVLDGKMAGCCVGRGLDQEVLRAAGLGQPIP